MLTLNQSVRFNMLKVTFDTQVNIKQENGETPLHIAARKGNTTMARLLLSEEADPMATSKV